MSKYDIIYIGRKAKELGFIRDTFEKVTRLVDILEYFNTNPTLKNNLALKGGTAINLTIFKLPRLSVDINLDYLIRNSREEMLKERKIIHETIERYMLSQEYFKSSNTRITHSLDSFVYDYVSASDNKDNIKIEINYSLRSHLLKVVERPIIMNHFSSDFTVKSLDPIEIYGSKMNALLNRSAARDLYDIRNMIHYTLFEKSKQEILKKCIIFYAAISAKDKNSINTTFNTKAMDTITNRKIKRELLPMLNFNDDFKLESAKNLVKDYISELMVLSDNEIEFLDKFKRGEYAPDLLFNDEAILNRIRYHPMALWKTSK